MNFDIHLHVLSSGVRRFVSRHLWRRYVSALGLDSSLLDQRPDTEVDRLIIARTAALVDESSLDAAVLLPLDAAYDEDGRCLPGSTLRVDNDFVEQASQASSKLCFAASIHPWRKDALRELDKRVERGACLIKWIPSAQNIRLDSSRCLPFYEALAHHGVPLLVHLGAEHVAPNYSGCPNDPLLLLPALERGVQVIGAHCGARLYLHEKCWFQRWGALARRFDGLYGDISFFLVPTRIHLLRRIARSSELSARVVYGSDFPCPGMAWCAAALLGWRKFRALSKIGNPLERTLQCCAALGISSRVFSRGADLIRRKPQAAGALSA